MAATPATPAIPTSCVRDLVLCNDAHLRGPVDGTWETVGDPMEAALLVAAAKRDPDVLALTGTWARVDETPFDSETKLMTTLHDGPEGHLLVCKGAPEAVLALTADPAVAEEARREAARLAEGGFRVLAVADRAGRRPDPTLEGLRLRGLVALVDPARTSALEVVRACRDAGIRIVMITGDHPATARAIADDLTITRDTPRAGHR